MKSGDEDAAERVDVNVSVAVLVPLAEIVDVNVSVAVFVPLPLEVAGHVFASVAVDVSDKIDVRVIEDDDDDDALAEREAVVEREAEKLRIDNGDDVLENVPRANVAVPQFEVERLICVVRVSNAVGLDDSVNLDDTLPVANNTVNVAFAENEGVPDGENEPVLVGEALFVAEGVALDDIVTVEIALFVVNGVAVVSAVCDCELPSVNVRNEVGEILAVVVPHIERLGDEETLTLKEVDRVCSDERDCEGEEVTLLLEDEHAVEYNDAEFDSVAVIVPDPLTDIVKFEENVGGARVELVVIDAEIDFVGVSEPDVEIIAVKLIIDDAVTEVDPELDTVTEGVN